MKLKSVCALLFAISFLSSCKKKNDKPVILVTPSELIVYNNPGDVRNWYITVTSDIKVERLLIYTQVQNDFEVILKDSSVSAKSVSFTLQYVVPVSTAGKLIYFRFKAIDEEGNYGEAIKEIQVGDKLLVETSALQFSTRSNNSNNAFDLETLLQESASFSDSTMRDIQEYTADTTAQSPSYFWFSPAGGKFIKSNNYDYGNATLLSAKNLFDGSVQKDITDSLVPGDIYITRLGSLGTAKYVVIKLISINDSPGNNLDNYTFNVKR